MEEKIADQNVSIELDMFDAFDSIDEKLNELKLTTASPEYSYILSEFSWTREWFTKIEDVLLALAFRGESDKIILDFIRKKIRETDVVKFNKIMAQLYGAEPICNHYDIVINSDAYHENRNINNSDAMVDYIIKNFDKVQDYSLPSRNTNDKIVLYLTQSKPEAIHWLWFSANPNDIAVDFILENLHKAEPRSLVLNTNDKIAKYLVSRINIDELPGDYEINPPYMAENKNDIIVDHIFKLMDRGVKVAYEFLSRNTNPRVTRFLVEHPEHIHWNSFSANCDDIAVDYLLNNIDKVNLNMLKHNINPKVTQYLIDNPLYMTDLFMSRSDDIAADYLLKNFNNANWHSYSQKKYLNKNDQIMEYLMKENRDKINMYYIQENTCNYYLQKTRVINSLNLFARIPHLKF